MFAEHDQPLYTSHFGWKKEDLTDNCSIQQKEKKEKEIRAALFVSLKPPVLLEGNNSKKKNEKIVSKK